MSETIFQNCWVSPSDDSKGYLMTAGRAQDCTFEGIHVLSVDGMVFKVPSADPPENPED